MTTNLLLLSLLVLNSLCQQFIVLPQADVNNQTLRDILRVSELSTLNQQRLAHGVGQLTLNQSLNQEAQAYAKALFDKVVPSQPFGLAHSGPALKGLYGQNLFMSAGLPTLPYTYSEATTAWYNEVKFYDFDTTRSTDPSQQIGHFTAQIWKGVKSVGFGFYWGSIPYNYGSQTYQMQLIFVVANYYPTPNIVGLYRQNVLPPL